ncbi:hypothetical protein FJZ28_05495 [Candidatus Peregrinibacteria bacterium]|nr:hypothetical protein [Candidatus Peregrinibacteria bacterium]
MKSKKNARKSAKAKKKKVTRVKARKVKKVKATKKPAKKKLARKVSAREISRAAQAVQARLIGKVVHYYDKIGVAIVDLNKPLRIGDTVLLKRGTSEEVQRVTSLQIEHIPVIDARKGDVVGMKVEKETPEGTVVLPA